MSLCLTGLQANNEDDDSDGEYTDDGTEETALESYQTPLDEETCPVDEYMIFKTVLQSKHIPIQQRESGACMCQIFYQSLTDLVLLYFRPAGQ